MVLILTACSKGSVPVTIGNISFSFDEKVWTIVTNKANEPLEFADKNDNKLSLNVSQESTYQHPMAMITFIENLISDNSGFQVFIEPNEITVNGTTWYEYGYIYDNGTSTSKVYQRYYGKYYNAASITYTSTPELYDSGYNEALKFMSDIKVEEVSNKENEEKAKDFLVGEWDLDGKGYLVLSEDGNYDWFSDSSKDNNNKHYGTYGCDIENSNMNMVEGDGFYLVLFPDALVIDGITDTWLQYKSDYLISLKDEEKDGYQMVNLSSYALFIMTRQ
jgi:hypothetical protein